MKFSMRTKIIVLLAVFWVMLTSSVWAANVSEDEILTVSNNKDLAKLLKSAGGGCEAFVAKYKGRTIRFDGCIAAMSRDGKDYGRHSHYNFLIYAWDYAEDTAHGSPTMRFNGVTVRHLKIAGDPYAPWLREGSNLRFTAKVDKYDPKRNWIILVPVLTERR